MGWEVSEVGWEVSALGLGSDLCGSDIGSDICVHKGTVDDGCHKVNQTLHPRVSGLRFRVWEPRMTNQGLELRMMGVIKLPDFANNTPTQSQQAVPVPHKYWQVRLW